VKNSENSILSAVGAYLLLLAAVTGFTFTCKYIIIHSGIHFDFEHLLSLNGESYFAMSGLIVLLLVLFGITHFLTTQTRKFIPKHNKRILLAFLVLFLFVPVFHYLPVGAPLIPLIVGCISYILLADLYIIKRNADLTWLISWMIILCSLSSVLLFNYYLTEDINQRMKQANDLLKEPDPELIKAIDFFKQDVSTDTFVRNLLAVPYPFKIHKDEFSYIIDEKLEKQKLLTENFSVILNVFDQTGNAIVYDQFTPLAYYKEQQKSSERIGSSLYFDPILESYLWQSSFQHPGYPNSPLTLFFEFQNMAIQKHPEKLLKYTYDKAFQKPSYAIYRDDSLITAFGNDFRNTLPKIYFQEDQNYSIEISSGKSNLYYKKDAHTIIQLSRKTARLIKPISLFSFLFVLMGILIVIISLLNNFLDFIPEYFPLKFGLQNSLRKKMQLSFILLIITSFIIIGFVTLYYFRYLSKDYNNDLLTEKTIAITSDVQARIQAFNSPDLALQAIATNIYTISKTHQSDVHLFDHLGDLINSSSPKIFEFDFISQKMDSSIIQQFQSSQANVHIETEAKLNDLSYTSVTIPITHHGKENLGFLNLNYAPQIKAQNNVADFVSTLLNVYVFLFLFAGAIALAMANSITRPIAVLGEKLKALKLGKNNQLLEWKNKDELGELIENYNEMVVQLDQSAKFMAKTEREMAWREMARQVAHEIKNPLTPMKLYIQQIQRAIANKDPNTQDMIERISHTLIEQINSLTQIANEFSNFGTLPRADNEKIVLNEVVEAVHDLFRKREDIKITLTVPFEEIFVFADKNHLIRVLNNIVKNAIQSIPPENESGMIEIKLYKEEDKAIIKVTDNGIGIPDHMKEKIFTPNFTTKSSGTGLGLAISANIVEAFDGKLNFKSEYGSGTQFYIELPLMHLQDNFKEVKRVSLD
jgi:signal transduction histidine kinase